MNVREIQQEVTRERDEVRRWAIARLAEMVKRNEVRRYPERVEFYLSIIGGNSAH